MANDSSGPGELAVIFDPEQANERIRKAWHDGRWFVSVVDVIGLLTDSPNPRNYWSMLKRRLRDEGASEVYMGCRQIGLRSRDGKVYLTQCATEDTLQVIMRRIPHHSGHRQRSGHVYAIQPTTGGLVKLGYARDVLARLGQIQNMCPVPLRVVWHRAGTADDEELLHASFAERRQHGEWFDLQGVDITHALDMALSGQAVDEARVG